MSLWCVMIRAEELYGDQHKSAGVTPNSGGSGDNSPQHGSPRAAYIQPNSYGKRLAVPSNTTEVTHRLSSTDGRPISPLTKESITRPSTSIRDILNPSTMSQDRIQSDETSLAYSSMNPANDRKRFSPDGFTRGRTPITEESVIKELRGESKVCPLTAISPGQSRTTPCTQTQPQFALQVNPQPCEILNLTKDKTNVSQSASSSAPPRVFSYCPSASAAPPKPRNTMCSLWSRAVTPILEEGLRAGISSNSSSPNRKFDEMKIRSLSPKTTQQTETRLNSVAGSDLHAQTSTSCHLNENSYIRKALKSPVRGQSPVQNEAPVQQEKPSKYSPYKPHPRFRRPIVQNDEDVSKGNMAPQGHAKFDLFHYLISRALSKPEAATLAEGDTHQSVTIDKPLDLSVNIKFKPN